MTATRTGNARKAGKYLAALLSDRPGVHGIWARQSDQLVELWLVVETDELQTEREFHVLLGDVLDSFPETDIDFRLVNLARTGESGARNSVPHEALKIDT